MSRSTDAKAAFGYRSSLEFNDGRSCWKCRYHFIMAQWKRRPEGEPYRIHLCEQVAGVPSDRNSRVSNAFACDKFEKFEKEGSR